MTWTEERNLRIEFSRYRGDFFGIGGDNYAFRNPPAWPPRSHAQQRFAAELAQVFVGNPSGAFSGGNQNQEAHRPESEELNIGAAFRRAGGFFRQNSRRKPPSSSASA
jgi:hypothetical protein